MKNFLPLIIFFSAGVFILNSCITLTPGYTNDVYYNPESDNTPAIDKSIQSSKTYKKPQDTLEVDSLRKLDNLNGDYSEYAERLRKFHDDEYQGEYYEEDEEEVSNEGDWQVSLNFGFNPYGSMWGFNVGYGYPYFGYYNWGNPYYYGYFPWYDPFYSWYSPYYWHHPWHYHHYWNWYSPYYSYYDGYWGWPYYNQDDEQRGIVYGPRDNGTINTDSPYSNSGENNIRKDALSKSGMGIVTSGSSPISKDNDVVTGSNSSLGETRKVEGNTSLTNKMKPSEGITIENKEKVQTTTNTSMGNKGTKTTPNYTRTVTQSMQELKSGKTRSGYTPSYTRQRTTSTPTYNNSGNSNSYSINRGNSSSGTTTRNPNTSTGSSESYFSKPRTTSNSGNSTSNSTYTKPNSSSHTKSSANSNSGSTYTAPRSSSNSNTSTNRSSGTSYSAPKSSGSSSGSSNRSSGSSYSAPRSSGSSSSNGNRSSSSGSSYSAPRSSGTSSVTTRSSGSSTGTNTRKK